MEESDDKVAGSTKKPNCDRCKLDIVSPLHLSYCRPSSLIIWGYPNVENGVLTLSCKFLSLSRNLFLFTNKVKVCYFDITSSRGRGGKSK